MVQKVRLVVGRSSFGGLTGGIDRFLVLLVVFLACFMLAFAAGSLVISPRGTGAVTGLGLVGAATMSLASNTGTVVVDMTPSGTGAAGSGSHTLTASTNVPSGYNLSLEAATTAALAASAGTLTVPVALANNTWGYAMNQVSSSTSANTVVNGFDAAYAVPVPGGNSKWANPTVRTVVKNTTAAAAGDSTTVYYGAKVDMGVAAGLYSNTVTYTAAANVASLPVPNIISITPNVGDVAGGTALTIVGTGFTVNDQSVTTGVMIGGVACGNVSIASNTPTVGRDTVECVTLARAAGTVNVVVTTWGGSDTEAGGYRYKLPAVPMQEVTMDSCTTTRTLAYDVRDNATYWIQKMADGRCWMLTNLAYGGGGTDIYGDAKSISKSNSLDYAQPYYMIPTGSNRTTNPTDPSTSTDGGVTNPQYGYLYNWCAAMGVQVDMAVCSSDSTAPAADYRMSICPSGWRLPTGNVGGEFQMLNDAVNGGSTSSTTNLLSGWLAMYGGSFGGGGVGGEGGHGSYWSSTPVALASEWAYQFLFDNLVVYPGIDTTYKQYGMAVRCILDIPAMQEMSIDECTSKRVMAYDARDNRTYWVQKMADGKCWMLTNLAYGGDGTNTYGDAKSINLNSTNSGATNTSPEYYVPTGANATDYPVAPSKSTYGTGQYGYLYNWCAAMGAQTGTSACGAGANPASNARVSICPAGWRLPSGNTSGEFLGLTDAIGATENGSSTGLDGSAILRSSWLAMYSGNWYNGFVNQGSYGYYWSSTGNQSSNYILYFYNQGMAPSYSSSTSYGRAVRCVMDEVVAGDKIQTVSVRNCPAARIRVNDARDDASYWVQRMADGECWMLTNLAYGGGGTNTYGDVKTISLNSTNAGATFTSPEYYIPTNANKTTGITDPSTSTDGGATSPQYGYLYNWCAAMGAQTSTGACAIAMTPSPDQNISICPAGWRLPTGGSSSELQALTTAIGATNNAAGSASLRSAWLVQYSGNWYNDGFSDQGSSGSFWSSTQNGTMSIYGLTFGSPYVYSSHSSKSLGFAVRCVSS